MQRQRADREVDAAQAQRGQSEDQPKQRSGDGRRGQRDPERGAIFLIEHPDRIGTRRQQPCAAERDLTRVAGEQH
jgi:hypothetical protein